MLGPSYVISVQLVRLCLFPRMKPPKMLRKLAITPLWRTQEGHQVGHDEADMADHALSVTWLVGNAFEGVHSNRGM